MYQHKSVGMDVGMDESQQLLLYQVEIMRLPQGQRSNGVLKLGSQSIFQLRFVFFFSC